MADVNANIDINIDSSNALAQLKALQRQISQFHTSISKSSEAAALAQRDLQKNLLNSINSIGAFSAEMRTVKTSAESFTESLEKNKFSMREYFRYAGASTKTFGKLFKSEFDTVGKVAEERVKRLQTQYIKMGRDTNGAMRAIAVMPTQLNMEDYTTKVQLAAQKQALFNQLMKQGSTNLLNFGKNTQWAGRQLMVGFTLPLMAVGTAATKTFMEMEAQALKFKKVYGDLFTPQEETQQALDNITELGKQFTKYGVAVSTTVGLAAEAAAAGFSGLDLQRQTTEATRLSILGQIDSQQALETTISLQNAFGMSSEKLADSINFLNAVENQTVVSLDDITIAIPKVAPVIQQLGGDVKDLTFFMAAMKEGGINASEGANALKSGLAALINPTKKASDMLAGFGINANEIVTKNKGNLKATVVEFATALNQLDPLNRARAIEQMFGKFQFARLSTLFANVAKDGNQAARVLALANSSVEELSALSEQELGMTADSAMNKFKKTVEDLKVALIPVGQAFLEAVTPIIDFVGNILEKFDNLSNGTKKLITLLTVGIGAVGPVLLMTFGLFANGIANIIKLFLTLRGGYQRLTGQTQILGEQTQYMTSEQIDAASAAHSLNQTHANLTQTFNAEATAINKLIAAYTSAAGAARNFAINNPGMMLPGRGARKLASGIVSVPGPKGAGDVVPAMLSPGEAVIPTEMAKKYAPLIQGMIADKIPGYKKGNLGETVGTVLGGSFMQRRFSPIAMMAPGNTASGFGMDPEWLQLNETAKASFASALKTAAMAEAGIRQTSDNYNKFWVGLNPVLDGIFDIFKSGISDEVTSVAQLGEQQYPKIVQHIQSLEQSSQISADQAEQLSVALRKLVSPLLSDKTQTDIKRIELALNESGQTVVKRASYERFGDSLKEQTVKNFPRELAQRNLPVPGNMQDYTFAHIPQASATPTYIDPFLRKKAGAGNAAEQKVLAELKKGASFKEGQVVANAAIQGAKEGAASASPSKKTIPIGQDIARGLEVGMASRQGDVAKAGTTLANAAVGGVRNVPFRAPGQPGSIASSSPAAVNLAEITEKARRNRDQILANRQAKRIEVMNARMNNLNKAFMSGTFALSALSGVASMAGGNLGKFSEILFQISGPLFALSSIIQLLTGQKIIALLSALGALKLGVIAVGITALGVGLKLTNDAKKRELEYINGLSNAMKTTTKQVKTLGDFFGVVPTKLPFEGKNREIVGKTVRSQRDALRADESFQEQFAPTIKTLSKATAQEAELAFTSLALNLKAQGFATEQVQTIIDALREEAGKTDVKIDVKSLNFSEEAIKKLQSQIAAILVNFDKNFKVEPTGLEKFLKGLWGSLMGDAPEVVTMTNETKKSLSELSTFISETAKSSAGMFKLGLIDGDQFEASLTGILSTLNGLDEAARRVALIDIFKQLGINAGPFLKNLQSAKQEMMLIALLSSGVLSKDSPTIKALSSTDPKARARAINRLTQEYIGLFGAVAKVNEEDAKLNGEGNDGQAKGELKGLAAKIQALKDQTEAFTLLISKQVDYKTALELTNDSEIVAEILANKNLKTTKQRTDALKKYLALVEEFKVQSKINEETVADPRDVGIARLENLQKFIALNEKLIDLRAATKIKEFNDEIEKQEGLLEKVNDQIQTITQNQIEPIQKVIDANNYVLEQIALQEDAINEKYNKQIEALDTIEKANQNIANIQKQRMSIADALTRGDISAAAQAVQEARTQNAQSVLTNQRDILTSARDENIKKLGRIEIEKRNKVLQLEIATIEKQKLLTLQEQKNEIEDSIDATNRKLKALNTTVEKEKESAIYAGKTKLEIDTAKTLLELSKGPLDAYAAKLAGSATNATNLANELERALKAMLAMQNQPVASAPSITNPVKYDEIQSRLTAQNIAMGIEPGAAAGLAGMSSRLQAQADAYFRANPQLDPLTGKLKMAMGGMVPKYFVSGGYSRGTDTIPAMLTPGEFVVKRNAVDSFGVNNLNKINDGSYSGSSVYNYNLNLNVKSESNADDIARTVMTQIKRIDNQRIRTQRGL
jgi:TP901 family phage tail tape measure protein